MIRIGIAQVPQTAVIEKNLEKAIEYMEKAKEQNVELLCFPETHLSGYRACLLAPESPCDEHGLTRALQTIKEKCAELSLGVIIGTETPNSKGKPFNSAVIINKKGELVAVNHKAKLTPTDARAYATPDTGPTFFTFKGIPMGIVICFEAYRFPEQTRNLVRQGAKVVVQPQFNDFDKTRRWKQPVFEALIVARAAENNIYFEDIFTSIIHINDFINFS